MKVRYTDTANDENDQLLAGIVDNNPAVADEVAATIEAAAREQESDYSAPISEPDQDPLFRHCKRELDDFFVSCR